MQKVEVIINNLIIINDAIVHSNKQANLNLNFKSCQTLPLGPGAWGPGGPLFNYTNTILYIWSLIKKLYNKRIKKRLSILKF